jgi:hypothetical protein
MSTYPESVPLNVPVSSRAAVVVPTRALSWGAIFAGSFTALASHLLLTLASMGLGLQSMEPLTEGDAVSRLAMTAGISWTVSALISLWIGGWVAGRFADVGNHSVGRLHGLAVWSLATVVTYLSFTVDAGLMAMGASKLAGAGIAAVGKAAEAAAPGASDAFQTFTKSNGGIVSSFLDEVTPADAGRNGATNPAKARREIGWAAYRFFSEDGGVRSPENQAELAQTIAQTTGRSEADSQRIVGEWVTSYDQAKQELETTKQHAADKLRAAAEKTKDAATTAALWTFVAFLVGLASAVWGGHAGAKRWWNAEYPEVSRDPFPQP